MLSLIDEIKKIIPKEFSVNAIEAFLKKAEEYSDDSEFSEDAGSAREFVQIIDNIRGQSKFKDFPEFEKRLKMLSIKLHWMYGLALDTNLKSDLVSLNLVEAIKAGIDVLSGFSKWLSFYEVGVEVDEKRRSDMMYLLSNNSEWIGNNKIATVNGSSVPTVQNWIKDFLVSLPPASELPSSLDKVNYFTNNTNVQRLNPGEKEILSRIIDIYKYLKNPGEKINAISAPVRQSYRETRISTPPPIKPRIPEPTPQPVVQEVPKIKEMTAFEKKLEAISVAPKVEAHGTDLEVLKHRMEAVAAPKPVAVVPMPKVNQPDIVKEIRREVATPELPAHEAVKSIPKPVVPVVAPRPVPKPVVAAPKPVMPVLRPVPPPPVAKILIETPPTVRPASSFAANLGDVKNIDDLKRIGIDHLRRGPIHEQVQQLKTKIIDLARVNRVIPDYALAAFEESPLFRLYLAHGNAIFSGLEAPGDLSKDEFEAIADLRKEIQRSN